MTTDQGNLIQASPEKEFFISMLVRDIELIPAIGDLVDNSVDSARTLRPRGSLNGLHVHVKANAKAFEIADNCGGISVDDARRYAFRFGRPQEFTPRKGSIGQFGVGMKRAIFKLGRAFRIASATETSEFEVDVDVDEWAAEDSHDWTFTFSKAREGQRISRARRGTTIEVTRLNAAVAQDLGKTEVIGRLRALMALQHQAAIEAGLEVKVNGKRLAARRPTLLASAKVKPINRTVRIRENGGVVAAKVVAGIASPRPRDERDEGDAEAFTEPADAGWYIFCNDRLVVAADRSELTGWGSATASYHPQYRRFRGYLYLSADDSALLPWNTTKTGIDQDSAVFRAAQQQMFSALQAVVTVLNRVKQETQTKDESEQVAVGALAHAKEVAVDDLAKSAAYVIPEPPSRARRSRSSTISVQYRVDRELMRKAMESLSTESASDVGRRTFEYYMDAEVEP